MLQSHEMVLRQVLIVADHQSVAQGRQQFTQLVLQDGMMDAWRRGLLGDGLLAPTRQERLGSLLDEQSNAQELLGTEGLRIDRQTPLAIKLP
jgi:hypothetical protein